MPMAEAMPRTPIPGHSAPMSWTRPVCCFPSWVFCPPMIRGCSPRLGPSSGGSPTLGAWSTATALRMDSRRGRNVPSLYFQAGPGPRPRRRHRPCTGSVRAGRRIRHGPGAAGRRSRPRQQRSGEFSAGIHPHRSRQCRLGHQHRGARARRFVAFFVPEQKSSSRRSDLPQRLGEELRETEDATADCNPDAGRPGSPYEAVRFRVPG